ncbi:actin-like ATPase domain-containing protein [Penicillium manginii]|uniref:actin-like ATPase domain-containing protein n=1 Tax=Penicillium manginii TaxID=203109 RepID=UPI002548500F|nr:actin-like ATPase domain-containing protein [Penicillium manginii]KAJ5744286.1 actin-like ATPase domain-containing protein [Penicillium manginii]
MARTVTDPALQAFLRPLKNDIERLYSLSSRLSLTYRELAASSSELFSPTATTRLPTGREKGRYLAVYLGLHYLRVAFIELLGEEQVGKHSHVRRTLEKAWPIEDRLRRDQATSLFAWIGDCIAEVIHDDLANSKVDAPSEVAMGISFCFPIKQKFHNEAILLPTGKGFALGASLNLQQALLDGYECHTRRSDEDPAEMPAKRQKKYCLPKLKITVMTNDTIATLASLAYSIRALPNTRVVMGLICGAGCNSAVPMKLADLQEEKTQHIRGKAPDAVDTVVSTEWTLRGASAPLEELGIVTDWDKELDVHSDRPGFQPLEYLIGGRYMGELVRIICFEWFHKTKAVPRESLPLQLVERFKLTTDFLSLVVATSYSDVKLARELSERIPPPESSDWAWTPEYAGHIRSVAAAVQDRSAALVAAATLGLLSCTREIRLQNTEQLDPPAKADSDEEQESAFNATKIPENGTAIPGWKNGPEELVVAVSGGVIRHYPHYKETIQRYIDRLLISAGPQSGGKSIFLREANDGGIIGVGVLAGTVAGEINGIISSSQDEAASQMGAPNIPSFATKK